MIRLDFVSNSSSSSFMIIGTMYNYDEMKDILKMKYPDKDIDSIDVRDEFWYMCDKCGLNANYGLDSHGPDCMIVGLEYDDMKPDETKKEFENRISNILKDNKIPNDDGIRLYMDQGYDG